MEFPVRDWSALLEWIRAEARKKRAPRCLETGAPPTLDPVTAEFLRKHVNHWLATDAWPPMEETDEEWVQVFLRFALDEMERVRQMGAPLPVTEAEAKGVVQGILQNRHWPAAGPAWMERCLREDAGLN